MISFQSFNDSITNSSTYGDVDFAKFDLDSSGTLDTSNNMHSNSSYLTEPSPGSSPGVSLQPVNYVSWKIYSNVDNGSNKLIYFRLDWEDVVLFMTVMLTMTMSLNSKKAKSWWFSMSALVISH